jgi:hypothetical protein
MIINQQIETPVTSQEWGLLRARYNLPTRNKKKRKTHVKLRRNDGGTMLVPVQDYSAPVLLYRFRKARILSGVPRDPGENANGLTWTVSMLTSHDVEMEMQRKFPEWNKQHSMKAMPFPFARMLAKIAYGYVFAEWGGNSGFSPMVLDIILGKSNDYFYTVGGEWEIADPIPGSNHITNIKLLFTSSSTAFIIVDIRLFPTNGTPDYHIVVGQIDLKNPSHLAVFAKHRLDGKIEEAPLGLTK